MKKRRTRIWAGCFILVCLMLGMVIGIPASAINLTGNAGNLPSGFTGSVIGNLGENAERIYDEEEKEFVIEGTGLGIGDEGEDADSYHYVSYELSGDASFSACLSDYEIENGKEGQFGIAFRSDPSSVTADYLALYFEPAYHKFYVSWREEKAEITGKEASNAIEELGEAYYFHLENHGSTIYYEVASDPELEDKILSGKVVFTQGPAKWNAGFCISNKGGYQPVLAVFDQVMIKGYSQVYFDSSVEQRPIDTVKNVKAESQNQAVKISWELNNGAKLYKVYRSEESDEDFLEQAEIEGTETVFVDLDVKNYKRYFYRIVAVNEKGTSYPSEIVSAFPNPSDAQKVLHGSEAAQFTVVSEISETVLEKELMFKGYFSSNGILNASINGEYIIIDRKNEANDSILISLEFHPGRNVLELTLENEEGYLTKQQYQFVYLNKQSYDYIVDPSCLEGGSQNGDGKRIFATIQEAVDDAADLENKRYRSVIFVRKGVYNEQLLIDCPLISIIGEDRNSTIVTFESSKGNVRENAVLHITPNGTGFSAENIAFENRTQSDGTDTTFYQPAVLNEADSSMFLQCGMSSQAGTVFAGFFHSLAARQYYHRCSVQGETALITGNAQAVWEDCEILSREGTSSFIKTIAAPFTREEDRYGFLFYNCMFWKAKKLQEGSVYLGAVPADRIQEGISPCAVFLDCYLDNHIRKDAYRQEDEITLRFYEFADYGPGMAVNEARKQLIYKQAQKYTREEAFKQDAAVLTEGKAAYESSWDPLDPDNPISINMLYESKQIPLTSLQVGKKLIQIKMGESEELQLEFVPFNTTDRNVIFESLNESVAEVSESGVIAAIHPGYAVIQIYAGDCQEYAVVEVFEKNLPFFSIPFLWAQNKEIEKGSSFSPLQAVRAYDRLEGEITDQILVTKNTVDVSRAGVYEVWYVVKNSQNRMAGRKIQVIVK